MNHLISKEQTKEQKRFTNIYNSLIKGEYFTTKEIAEKEGVSQKTIQNDIRELIEQGIIQKDGHKYFMPKEYRNEEALKEAEMSSSMMSALFYKAFPNIDTAYIFQQYPKNGDSFYFDFLLEKIDDEQIVANIIYAISHKLALSYSYTNRASNTTKKTSYPLKISNFSGTWYMIAYDLEKDVIHTYHLNSITDLELEEDNYLYSKREKLEKEANSIFSAWYSNKPKVVTLKVQDESIEYIKRKEYPHLKIIQESSDVMYLSMTYYNSAEVIQFVKQWIPYITIEDNEKLNQELKSILQIALQQIGD